MGPMRDVVLNANLAALAILAVNSAAVHAIIAVVDLHNPNITN